MESVYEIISKEEYTKYKEWFEKKGYQQLPSNPSIILSNDRQIQMRVAYTLSRTKIEWTGQLTDEFVNVWATGNTPMELETALLGDRLSRLIKLRNKLNTAIYLAER